MRSIIHVDMDAFFASVEERERPELRGRPVIVGGSPEGRGVVAAANYIARRYGVHSAMPAAHARRLCPDAVFLTPRHELYGEISAAIRAIFHRYTPLVEPLSVDEAFLDASGCERLFGSPREIGRAIKEAIREELGLVASVGIAPNKFLAKLASDFGKPDGFMVVDSEEVDGFLAPMPVSRLWGVGPAGARAFGKLGIATIGQLRAYSLETLTAHFGQANGPHLWRLARGLDERQVVAEREARSISHETTFERDISDRKMLEAWLLELTEQVAWRLRRHGWKARTVQIKVRFSDFSTITRSQTLECPTDITREFRHAARNILANKVPPGAVRLIGVGVSGFGAGGAEQRSLFEEGGRERQSRLDAAMDAIQERFGRASVRRGRFGPKE